MKKRALLIAFHFPPQAASSGIQRTLSFSKHLGSSGWEPLILSASPIAYSFKNSSQLATLPHDLIVKRAFAIDTKRHLGIKGRYLEIFALPDRWSSWWLSGVLTGLIMIRKYRPSVLWSTFPIATAPLIGLTLHRITNLPWVVDFRDPMLQIDHPTTKMQRAIYKWIENKSIHHCQRAIFTTHSAMNSYRGRFPEFLHEKFSVIENGYDEEIFNEILTANTQTSRKQIDKITLLHSGMLYIEGRNPTTFFKAISILKAAGKFKTLSLEVILRATGDDNYFIELVKKYSIDDIVKIKTAVPYREALQEMLNVDGLIVLQGKPFNTQIPAKIYEYFRAQKPIFGLIDPSGETARVLEKAGFKHMSSMDSAYSIIPVFEQFLSTIQNGTAHTASNEIIMASSRTSCAAKLAMAFNKVVQNI